MNEPPTTPATGAGTPKLTRTLAEWVQQPVGRYALRVVLIVVASSAIWAGLMALIGVPPALSSALNLVACGFFMSIQRQRDLHRAQVCLVVYAVAVTAPLALLFGTVDMWMPFAISTVFALAATGMRLLLRRRDFKPRRAWATLATGQDVPLTVRPAMCGTCDRRHHFVFAQDAPIPAPEHKLHVFFENPGRVRTDLVLALKVEADGRAQVITMPEDFELRQRRGDLNHSALMTVDGVTARPGKRAEQ